MPQGYNTIEQWNRPDWVAVAVLPFGVSLTAAERALERLGRPGFYRLVHTQRIVWCERDGRGVRLRKSHASSPESLKRMQEMFERPPGVTRWGKCEPRGARRSGSGDELRGSRQPDPHVRRRKRGQKLVCKH
jgi:hypothetical protein